MRNTFLRVSALLTLLLPALVFAQADAPAAESQTQTKEQSQNSRVRLMDDEISEFKEFAKSIPAALVEEIPFQSQGRIKSFESFSRESLLFVSGKYSPLGLKSVQAYLALIVYEKSQLVEVLNIRDVNLREDLGLDRGRRWFSLAEIEKTRLEELASPLLEKSRVNDKKLSPAEKNILEAFQQTALLREILAGEQFFQGLVFKAGPPMGQSDATHADGGSVVPAAQEFLKAIAGRTESPIKERALALVAAVKAQPGAADFQDNISKMSTEVFYLHLKPFFWAAIMYVLCGVLFLFMKLKVFQQPKIPVLMVALPLLFQVLGFSLRIYLTGFAPVTNMYGTMLWVSFGVVFFSSILLLLYNNLKLFGLLVTGAGALLMLTESIPLVLSPDMDPIVAVLRSNFWLSIHVLTITISYAAFTIAMLIGNAALIQSLFKPVKNEAFAELSRHAYRIIQLGVFLLTAGIILGGIWADYSWGRFWGWDPKETWALIADLGFLSILHARYVGWLKDFGLLAYAPVAYLLVVMAWYGVNFILAAGLHSYGFSSGGTAVVVGFVSAQLALIAAAVVVASLRKKS